MLKLLKVLQDLLQ